MDTVQAMLTPARTAAQSKKRKRANTSKISKTDKHSAGAPGISTKRSYQSYIGGKISKEQYVKFRTFKLSCREVRDLLIDGLCTKDEEDEYWKILKKIDGQKTMFGSINEYRGNNTIKFWRNWLL